MNEEYNLIQAARNGDQAAFGELVRQYQKRVFALAVRMCPTPELAEEAAQEAVSYTHLDVYKRQVRQECPAVPPAGCCR